MHPQLPPPALIPSVTHPLFSFQHRPQPGLRQALQRTQVLLLPQSLIVTSLPRRHAHPRNSLTGRRSQLKEEDEGASD